MLKMKKFLLFVKKKKKKKREKKVHCGLVCKYEMKNKP